ncbi:MAG: cytochrome c peroxidase [Polyangiales bacterium]
MNFHFCRTQLAVVSTLTSILTACAGGDSDVVRRDEQAAEPLAALEPSALAVRADALFGALPDAVTSADRPLTEPRIELGRTLYHDPRLSRGQELSCNSCHDLSSYGVDVRPDAVARGTSFGHDGQFGGRNAPTVYNAALHMTQFWDGRATDVEEQAKGPILNPIEMNMPDPASVMAVVASIPGYRPMFEAAFPGAAQPLSYDNLATAIGAFERVLVTPSRFDAFVSGDLDALTRDERDGLEVFIAQGCASCHAGPGFGGGSYQKLGAAEPFATDDEGRAGVTGDDADAFFFKVPSLRNIARTAPYFHDGSVRSLPEAVRLMARHQRAAHLTDDETARIVTFLHALTGELPRDRIAPPSLPPSGPATPAADPR